MKRSFVSDVREFEPHSKISATGPDPSLVSSRPRNGGFAADSSFISDANTLTLSSGKSNGTTNGNGVSQEVSSRRRDASIIEKTYIFTGTAERVLAWSRVCKHRCFFEVIASLVSIQASQDNFQNIILLKDKKGPILQVVHYFDHEMPEEDFAVGQMLRCVGYMTGVNTLTAVSIRRAVPDEFAALKRHCYFGDFTISGLINSEDNR